MWLRLWRNKGEEYIGLSAKTKTFVKAKEVGPLCRYGCFEKGRHKLHEIFKRILENRGLSTRKQLFQYINEKYKRAKITRKRQAFSYSAHSGIVLHTNMFITEIELLLSEMVDPGGPVVMILTSRSEVRGFDPGRGRWIFQSVKILSTTSFGREVTPRVPCRRFTARKRTTGRN